MICYYQLDVQEESTRDVLPSQFVLRHKRSHSLLDAARDRLPSNVRREKSDDHPWKTEKAKRGRENETEMPEFVKFLIM